MQTMRRNPSMQNRTILIQCDRALRGTIPTSALIIGARDSDEFKHSAAGAKRASRSFSDSKCTLALTSSESAAAGRVLSVACCHCQSGVASRVLLVSVAEDHSAARPCACSACRPSESACSHHRTCGLARGPTPNGRELECARLTQLVMTHDV